MVVNIDITQTVINSASNRSSSPAPIEMERAVSKVDKRVIWFLALRTFLKYCNNHYIDEANNKRAAAPALSTC